MNTPHMSFEEKCDDCKGIFHIADVKIFDKTVEKFCDPWNSEIMTLCNDCYTKEYGTTEPKNEV